MMKIQINSDSSVVVGDALVQTVEGAIRDAIDRYGDRITRVEAHLSEEDGKEGNDPEGTRCLLEVRPAGMDPVVVTGSADTIERAGHDAAQKMQRLLDSTFGRIDSRDADATIRQNRR